MRIITPQRLSGVIPPQRNHLRGHSGNPNTQWNQKLALFILYYFVRHKWSVRVRVWIYKIKTLVVALQNNVDFVDCGWQDDSTCCCCCYCIVQFEQIGMTLTRRPNLPFLPTFLHSGEFSAQLCQRSPACRVCGAFKEMARVLQLNSFNFNARKKSQSAKKQTKTTRVATALHCNASRVASIKRVMQHFAACLLMLILFASIFCHTIVVAALHIAGKHMSGHVCAHYESPPLCATV